MRARRAPGFTLLEVLAAVAIVGLVYVALGTAAIESLQRAGEANRRMQASLLADRVLADLEAALADGFAPELGEETRADESFAVTVRVEPFDLRIPELELPRAIAAATPGRRPGEPRAAGEPPSLLVGSRERPSALRAIEVEVAWVEGVSERRVVRRTFGLDTAAAAEVLGALEAGLGLDGAESPQ